MSIDQGFPGSCLEIRILCRWAKWISSECSTLWLHFDEISEWAIRTCETKNHFETKNLRKLVIVPANLKLFRGNSRKIASNRNYPTKCTLELHYSRSGLSILLQQPAHRQPPNTVIHARSRWLSKLFPLRLTLWPPVLPPERGAKTQLIIPMRVTCSIFSSLSHCLSLA